MDRPPLQSEKPNGTAESIRPRTKINIFQWLFGYSPRWSPFRRLPANAFFYLVLEEHGVDIGSYRETPFLLQQALLAPILSLRTQTERGKFMGGLIHWYQCRGFDPNDALELAAQCIECWRARLPWSHKVGWRLLGVV